MVMSICMSSEILYFKKNNNAAPDEIQNSLYTHISIIFTNSKHTNNSLEDSKPWYSMLLSHSFSLYLFHYQQHWYSHLTSLIPSRSLSHPLPPILDNHVLSATSFPSQEEEGMSSSLMPAPISHFLSSFTFLYYWGSGNIYPFMY